MSDTIFYGLPGLPLAMLGLPLFIYLPSFYSQNMGLSLSAVGLVLLLARSFDVITDPLIGILNDRFPNSLSIAWRRKSYILLGIPLLIVGLNFLLIPVDNVTSIYLFSWSFITYLGWTLINIPWLAMGAEISQKYHEKSNLASSREIFAAVGTISVMSIPVILSLQSDIKSTLQIFANILMLLIPLALIPLIFKVSVSEFNSKEKEKEKEKENKSNFGFGFLLAEIKAILKHPAIKKLLPSYFLNSVANALPATLFILYVTYILKTPEDVGVLLISYFLAAIIGIPFWLYMAHKTDKHLSWRYALYGSVASFIWVPFIGEGDFTPFLIICIASGFFLGADVVMPSSIQADISQNIAQGNKTISNNLQINSSNRSLDATQVNQHKNSTALLFGIWGMLTKLSLALAVGIAFPLLDMAGLSVTGPQSNIQSDAATFTLIVLYALIPIILKIWVIIQLKDFPYDHTFFSTHDQKSSKGKDDEKSTLQNINHLLCIANNTKRMQ